MKFNGIYRAKVLATDVSEDDKLGRIKVEVYPMLIEKATARDLPGVDGIDTSVLPWAIPAMPLFAGAVPGPSGGVGCLVIPEVGSYVWVFFEEGDIQQPVYFAEAQTAGAGLPPERLTNYPYTKVWKSAGGVVITINDGEGNEEIKVLHPTGTFIRINSSGDITVDAVSASGDVVVRGAKVRINP